MATKPMHNRAAKFNGRIDANRVTAEGFKRGTEVEFNLGADQMAAWYPRFKLATQYIVISVFKPKASGQKHEEVTLRDQNGDCYGYVESRAMKKFGEKNRAVTVLEDETSKAAVAVSKPRSEVKAATVLNVDLAAQKVEPVPAAPIADSPEPELVKGQTVIVHLKSSGANKAGRLGVVVGIGPKNITVDVGNKAPIAFSRADNTFTVDTTVPLADAAK